MIKVVVTYTKDENQKYISLEMSGHANSAPHGQDLVCAAASAIIVGGCNAINNKKAFEFQIEEGHALIRKKEDITRDDVMVLDTIVTQLKTLNESYAKFIKIEERTKD